MDLEDNSSDEDNKVNKSNSRKRLKKVKSSESKKVTKQENINDKNSGLVKDKFNLDSKLDIDTDICSFCKKGNNFGLILKSKLCKDKKVFSKLDVDYDENWFNNIFRFNTKNIVLDMNGIWASRYSLPESGNRKSFAHFFCALHSPRTFFDGSNWYNLYQ